MPQIIEIRAYQLHPDQAAQFARLIQQQSLPLLREHGTQVVYAGMSMHANDQYLLIRAYDDLTHRAQSQASFYSSAAWLQGPCDALMCCIQHYTTTIIPASAALISELQQSQITQQELTYE